MKENRIEEKLKRTEAKLNKASEERKKLKVRMKRLAEQAENERLSSRGKILESYLKEPLVLKNEDVAHLLDIMFRSDFTQRTLSEMIKKRKTDNSSTAKEVGDAKPSEDNTDEA